jgi:DNA-binding beta-propeller fold protein YncE
VEAAYPPGTVLAPGAIVGGYRIESVAGRGGMGIVYRATQIALDRPVALKLLATDLAQDEAFRERFQRESRLLASIDHPNVITVHEAGEHEGRLFIAMRYVVGTDLRELIKAEGGLEAQRAADLLAQAAAGLDAAHARGLIHRDVKPANILIDGRDGAEHAYLSDFGLTKQVGSSAAELTATGQWVGTVDYIAPEQVLGHHVDARADVYALGCVLYTALTGNVPFERPSAIATVFAHVNDPPPSLREALPNVPLALDAAVTRVLAKDPDDRFQSAGDLGRAAVAAACGDTVPTSDQTVARGDAAPVPAGETKVRGKSRTAVQPRSPRAGKAGRGRAALYAGLAALAALAIAGLVLALSGGGGSSDDGTDGDALHAKSIATQAISIPGRPTGIFVGDDEVWVAQSDNGTVVPIDAKTGRPGKPVAVGDGPRVVTVADGALYVTTDEGIRRVDLQTRRRGAVVEGALGEKGEIATGEGSLYASSTDENAVAKVDPVSLKVITSRRAPQPGLDGPIAVGAGSVWVVTNGDKGGFVARMDAGSLALQAKVPLGTDNYAFGIAFGTDAVWVVDAQKNLVYRIDPARNRVVAQIKVESGISSDDVAVGGGAVWLADTQTGRVVRIDPATNRVIPPSIPGVTAEEGELAVGLGSAWITNPDNGSVTRLKFG